MSRKVVYSVMVSLDGYMEGPGSDIGWHVVDEELHRHFNDRESTTDTHVYGRRLYETMAVWGTLDQNPDAHDVEKEYAGIWRAKTKLVFSSTLESVDWNSTLLRSDPVDEVARLKQQPGQDISVGGATLAASLAAAGLIDEYEVYVNPVVLGSGKPFLPAIDQPLQLTLSETRAFGNGVVLLRYEPAA